MSERLDHVYTRITNIDVSNEQTRKSRWNFYHHIDEQDEENGMSRSISLCESFPYSTVQQFDMFVEIRTRHSFQSILFTICLFFFFIEFNISIKQ
jgi:hypothetical protein